MCLDVCHTLRSSRMRFDSVEARAIGDAMRQAQQETPAARAKPLRRIPSPRRWRHYYQHAFYKKMFGSSECFLRRLNSHHLPANAGCWVGFSSIVLKILNRTYEINILIPQYVTPEEYQNYFERHVQNQFAQLNFIEPGCFV